MCFLINLKLFFFFFIFFNVDSSFPPAGQSNIYDVKLQRLLLRGAVRRGDSVSGWDRGNNWSLLAGSLRFPTSTRLCSKSKCNKWLCINSSRSPGPCTLSRGQGICYNKRRLYCQLQQSQGFRHVSPCGFIVNSLLWPFQFIANRDLQWEEGAACCN